LGEFLLSKLCVFLCEVSTSEGGKKTDRGESGWKCGGKEKRERFKMRKKLSHNMKSFKMYSGTPPYGHFFIMTTFLWPEQKPTNSFI